MNYRGTSDETTLNIQSGQSIDGLSHLLLEEAAELTPEAGWPGRLPLELVMPVAKSEVAGGEHQLVDLEPLTFEVVVRGRFSGGAL